MTKDYDYAWAFGWAAYLNGSPAIFPGAETASSEVYLGWHAGYSAAKGLHEAIGHGRSHAKMHTCHAKLPLDGGGEMR